MRLEARKYLYDIQYAADLLTEFTTGKTFADYERDAMLRAAVERQFEMREGLPVAPASPVMPE